MKVLLIGLDALTLDLAQPWMDQGLLPHLQDIARRGVSGRLRSIIPPVTAAAWTSCLTGMNPARHGIFDFIGRREGSYDIRYTSGADRRAPSLFSRLGAAGLRSVAVNVPMTYPPEAINGVLVSGLDAPGTDRTFTHPPELGEELTSAPGGYDIDLRYMGHVQDAESRRQILQGCLDLEEQHARAALYLMEREEWDLFMVVFMAADRVQHFFWRFMDETHPRHDPDQAEEFGDAILRTYQALDHHVGELLRAAPDDATVLVVSDHGAGVQSDDYFFPNLWLAKNGFLAFKEGSALAGLMGKLDGFVRSRLSPQQKEFIARRFSGLRERVESSVALGDVDWARTRVYCQEGYLMTSAFRVNVAGREPQGIVPPAQRVAVVDELSTALTAATDDDGRSLFPGLHRREEVMDGPYLEEAADLFVSFWDSGAYNFRPTYKSPDGRTFVQDAGLLPHDSDWSANHRLDGLLLAAGPSIKRAGALSDARLIDIAPTVLTLFGLPLPAEMDGRPLDELLDADLAATVSAAPAAQVEAEGGESYTEEDEALIEERLRQLGYVD